MDSAVYSGQKGNEKHIKIGTMDNIKVQVSMFAETPGVQDYHLLLNDTHLISLTFLSSSSPCSLRSTTSLSTISTISAETTEM